jgi:hypothetical protein
MIFVCKSRQIMGNEQMALYLAHGFQNLFVRDASCNDLLIDHLSSQRLIIINLWKRSGFAAKMQNKNQREADK